MTDTIQKIADEMLAAANGPTHIGAVQLTAGFLKEWATRLCALSARASAGEVGEAVAWRKAYQNGQRGEWRLMPVPSVVLEDANLRNWHGIEYAKFAATPQPATGDAATWEAIDEGGERHYFLREPVGWPNRKPLETPQPAAPQPQDHDCDMQCRYFGLHKSHGPLTPPAHGEGLQEVINSMEHDASDIRLGRQWMSACEHYLPKLRALATRPTPEAQEARDADFMRGVIESGRVQQSELLARAELAEARYGVARRYLSAHMIRTRTTWHDPVRHAAYLADVDAAIDAALALPAQGEGDNG